MQLMELWKLTRLSALPAPDDSKKAFREKERAIASFASMCWLVFLMFFEWLKLPEPLQSFAIVLSASAYVIGFVEGRARVYLLTSLATASVFLVVLFELFFIDVRWIAIVVFLAAVLVAAYVGRLQFVRSSSSGLKTWPSFH